jgi:uncharacterized repeat protein (TIGR01451 family)
LSIIHGSPDSLAVTASPLTIAADGAEEAVITARLRDGCGLAVPDTVVQFRTDLGTLFGHAVVSRRTNASGVAAVRLSGTESGVAQISAESGDLSDAVAVTLAPGPPQAVDVTLASSVVACEASTVVTAAVRDAQGNLVADGTPVTFTTDLAAIVEPASGETSGGLVTSTVEAYGGGSGAVMATTEGGVFGTAPLTITHGTSSSLAVTAAPARIEADGLDEALITATLVDPCGLPVPDATVRFTTSLGALGGSDTVTRITDGAGTATAALRGTRRGEAVITATAGALADVVSVRLTGVITVCHGGGCDFATIQDAVDDAVDGEEIRVAEGRYTGEGNEVVLLEKTLTLRGGYTTTNWTVSDLNGHPTVLDAEDARRGIYVAGAVSPTIENLQIVNGNAEGLGGGPWASADAGGGVHVAGASPLISGCHVLNGRAQYGGGVYFAEAGGILAAGVIGPNNDAEASGGGLYLRRSGVSVVGNTLTGNQAGFGAGLYVDASDGATLHGNSVESNTAASGGGGIYVKGGAPVVSQNAVFQNRTQYGAGLYLRSSDALVRENDVSDNESSKSGGGLCIVEGEATVEENSISGNQAQYGAGLYVLSSPGSVVRNNRLIDNDASYGGGGLYLHESDAQVEENEIEGNSADYYGGGVFVSGDVSGFDGNILSRNSAAYGGGGYLHGYGSATLLNAVVVDNHADLSGGGIGLGGQGEDASFIHATFARNVVGEATAAGLLDVENGNLEGSAREVGNGGALLVRTGRVVLTNTILVGHATSGIYVGTETEAALEATLWGSGEWANDVDWTGPGTVFTGTRNYYDNPVFKDPDAGDYHIRWGSPARDRGLNGMATSDVDGHPRPIGAGCDLGADEATGIDLSPSRKQVSQWRTQPGDTVTYTVVIVNSGAMGTDPVWLLDAIPEGISYVPGTCQASSGVVTDTSEILWSGAVDAGEAVTITYRALVNEDALIQNTAILTNSYGDVIQRTAVLNPEAVYLPLISR